MTNAEYQKRLHELAFTCEMNQLYHQTLEWRYGVGDKALKITVAILAIIGAVLAVPALDQPLWAFALAIAAAVAAVILNVFPVGETAKEHGEMFHAWGDLHADAMQEEHKMCEKDGDKDAQRAHEERLRELVTKKEALNNAETAAWPKLLLKCQGDVTERLWGDGIRTKEQAESEQARRLQSTSL